MTRLAALGALLVLLVAGGAATNVANEIGPNSLARQR